MKKLITSESVTEGHPDKLCDQISDGVLDAILKQDNNARVACETAVTTGMVLVMGEITTSAYVNIQEIARQTIKDVGYTNPVYGFDYETCSILTSIDEQSADIALGVNTAQISNDNKQTLGAGDQGLMYGYACNETKELMPMPIMYAHKLSSALATVRNTGLLDYLGPDGKSQVTVEYDDNNQPKRIDTVIISSQHINQVSIKTLRSDIENLIIKTIIPPRLLDGDTKIYINPTGRFVKGGPAADSGLTGRKIIVDTYGGVGRHGGGAFSGKDPTKVDRTGAYAARYIAKNIVAQNLADRCEVQLAYAIGIAQPVSVYIDTFGTGQMKDSELSDRIVNAIDLSPGALISRFDLQKPIYRQLASYGHFGREDLDCLWERRDLLI